MIVRVSPGKNQLVQVWIPSLDELIILVIGFSYLFLVTEMIRVNIERHTLSIASEFWLISLASLFLLPPVAPTVDRERDPSPVALLYGPGSSY